MTEWFEEWFGEEYLHLYPHRDEADAERMVGLLRRTLPWAPGWRVLDVGCGAGRHSLAFSRAQARVFGLDLSMSLLRRARETINIPLVRADMRWLPIRLGSMDLTANLFTSFGYFATDQEHKDALAGMICTVKVGGWFAIDFLNADAVRKNLVPSDTLAIGSEMARVTRAFTPDGSYVVKAIETPKGRKFMERVRLFRPEELAAMVAAGGASLAFRFGDYSGGPLTASSARCILIARKT